MFFSPGSGDDRNWDGESNTATPDWYYIKYSFTDDKDVTTIKRSPNMYHELECKYLENLLYFDIKILGEKAIICDDNFVRFDKTKRYLHYVNYINSRDKI